MFTQNVTLTKAFFKHFAGKNQLTGFYISGTLLENGLISEAHLETIPKALPVGITRALVINSDSGEVITYHIVKKI